MPSRTQPRRANPGRVNPGRVNRTTTIQHRHGVRRARAVATADTEERKVRLERPSDDIKRMLFSGAFNYNPEVRRAVHKPLLPRPLNPHVNYGRQKSLRARICDPAPIPGAESLFVGEDNVQDEQDNVMQNIERDEQDVETNIGDGMELDTPLNQEPKPLPMLLMIPVEIRNEIYKLLLVNDGPIRVTNNWTAIFKGSAPGRGRNRDSPAVTKNLLRVCGQIHDEAVSVLYGHNTFEYVVRNGIEAPQVCGTRRSSRANKQQDTRDMVEDISDDDDEVMVDDDSDSDYDEHVPKKRRAAPKANQAARHVPGQIYFDKYAHLFRHISIAIESNRYDHSYRRAMARAIELFVEHKEKKRMQAPLHTLTVRIYPLRADDDTLTHVDFFEPGSDVVVALQRLPVQYIRIRVGTSQLTSDRSTGFEVRLNRYYSDVMDIGQASFWPSTGGMVKRGGYCSAVAQSKMLSLRDDIMERCLAAEKLSHRDDDADGGTGQNGGGGDDDVGADDELFGPGDPVVIITTARIMIMPDSEEAERFDVISDAVEVDYAVIGVQRAPVEAPSAPPARVAAIPEVIAAAPEITETIPEITAAAPEGTATIPEIDMAEALVHQHVQQMQHVVEEIHDVDEMEHVEEMQPVHGHVEEMQHIVQEMQPVQEIQPVVQEMQHVDEMQPVQEIQHVHEMQPVQEMQHVVKETEHVAQEIQHIEEMQHVNEMQHVQETQHVSPGLILEQMDVQIETIDDDDVKEEEDEFDARFSVLEAGLYD